MIVPVAVPQLEVDPKKPEYFVTVLGLGYKFSPGDR
jgi:DNA-binding response OmpR family regulator